jgi:hypothetical protein
MLVAVFPLSCIHKIRTERIIDDSMQLTLDTSIIYQIGINSQSIMFPTKKEDLTRVFGPVTRLENGLNSAIFTWDSIGIWAYAESADSLIYAIYFKLGNEHLPVSPIRKFRGKIHLNKMVIDSNSTIDMLRNSPFEKKVGGFYMFQIRNVRYMIMRNMEDPKLQNFSINLRRPLLIRTDSNYGG